MASKKLSAKKQKELLALLKTRFEKNMKRHKGVDWADVQARLEKQDAKLWSLDEMERTGGEPDVIGRDAKSGEVVFVDCSAESPKERRSICYDAEALESRKKHKPADSAVNMAETMGIELLTEEEYSNVAEARRVRHEDIELGEDTSTYQGTRRRAVL
jgi:hypothetical protein